MARLVKHTETGPREVKMPSGDSIYACMCGLSGKKPLCDSSHGKMKDEEHGKIYVYDEGNRTEI